MVVNCEHVWREISNYLDGDVDPTLRAAMEAHFKQCKHCTAVLDGTRNVVELYGDDRLFELPAGFSQRLERRLAQQSSSSGYRSARSLWMLAIAAAALIAGGLTLGNSSAFRQPELRSHLALPAQGIPPTLRVVVSDDGKVFHVPGCKYLHKHDDDNPTLMTAADALRKGYAPCVRCLRQYLSGRVECPRLSSTPELWVERAPSPSVLQSGL